jgi:hypothetical protein
MSKLKHDRELLKLYLDKNPFDLGYIPNHYPVFMEIFILFNSTIEVLSMR